MAVKGNSSSEKTVRVKSKYTGLAPVRILSVNPSMKELNDMGISADKEPSYVINKEDGSISSRLDFWLAIDPKPETGDIVTKMTLWIDNTIFVGKNTGKTQFINKYGRTGWGMSASECGQYFIADGARPAYKGEEKIHAFLAAFLNTVYDTKNGKYDECQLDNPEAMFKGDFSEIKSIVRAYKDNTIRVMFGINEKGYQEIYTGYFEKTCITPNYTAWNNALTGQYTQFKADFQNEFTFQAYVEVAKPTTAKPDVETTVDEF